MPKKEEFQEMMERNTKKGTKEEGGKGKKVVVRGIFAIILLAALAGCGWAYWQYRTAQQEVTRLSSLEGQQEVAKQEVQNIVDMAKKHIILPTDEDPSVAAVTDVEALKSKQPFYADAQNGDKVLIYTKARKAVIYSPSRDILVNVGPIFVDKSQGGTEATTTPSESTENETESGEKVSPSPTPSPSPTAKPTKEE